MRYVTAYPRNIRSAYCPIGKKLPVIDACEHVLIANEEVVDFLHHPYDHISDFQRRLAKGPSCDEHELPVCWKARQHITQTV